MTGQIELFWVNPVAVALIRLVVYLPLGWIAQSAPTYMILVATFPYLGMRVEALVLWGGLKKWKTKNDHATSHVVERKY